MRTSSMAPPSSGRKGTQSLEAKEQWGNEQPTVSTGRWPRRDEGEPVGTASARQVSQQAMSSVYFRRQSFGDLQHVIVTFGCCERPEKHARGPQILFADDRGRRRDRRADRCFEGAMNQTGQQIVTWYSVGIDLLRLGVAYALAFPLGWNREREDRSVGLRTFPIVAVAACGFTILGSSVTGTPDSASRVLQGLITGIGFIGGGAIL